MYKFLLLLSLVFLSACTEKPQTYIELNTGFIQTAKTKEIVVVTHASPNTYFINADNQFAGIEYDLVKLFAKEHAPEYKIKFLVVNKVSDVLKALLTGKADIAAANLQATPIRQKMIEFATPYNQTHQKLVYNSDITQHPRKLADLKNKAFIVPAKSSSSEQLVKINRAIPELTWQEDDTNNDEALLRKVANGELTYTVANQQLVELMKNFYPNLQEGITIGEAENIAWAFSPEAKQPLKQKVNQFFNKIKDNGQLRNLLDRYYGHTERLDEDDIHHFLKLVESRLPKYKHLFKEAEKETGLNWRLIASLSFRESHWDPKNTSPTNVRGIMMLTNATAKELGVENRLDPEQSIPAGARYIKQLKDRFPSTIADQDRTYFALASYNIGYAHVDDARKLAKRLKLNPDSWADVKKTLMLLNKRQYYTTVKNGRASGGAPIVFVETIRSYQRILERHQPSKTQLLSDYFVAAT